MCKLTIYQTWNGCIIVDDEMPNYNAENDIENWASFESSAKAAAYVRDMLVIWADGKEGE